MKASNQTQKKGISLKTMLTFCQPEGTGRDRSALPFQCEFNGAKMVCATNGKAMLLTKGGDDYAGVQYPSNSVKTAPIIEQAAKVLEREPQPLLLPTEKMTGIKWKMPGGAVLEDSLMQKVLRVIRRPRAISNGSMTVFESEEATVIVMGLQGRGQIDVWCTETGRFVSLNIEQPATEPAQVAA